MYNDYLKRQPDTEVDKGIAVFEDVARNGNAWWIKLGGYQMLNGLQAHFSKRELEHKALAESLEKDGKTMEAKQEEGEAVKCKNQSERINSLILEMKNKETSKELLQYIK